MGSRFEWVRGERGERSSKGLFALIIMSEMVFLEMYLSVTVLCENEVHNISSSILFAEIIGRVGGENYKFSLSLKDLFFSLSHQNNLNFLLVVKKCHCVVFLYIIFNLV